MDWGICKDKEHLRDPSQGQSEEKLPGRSSLSGRSSEFEQGTSGIQFRKASEKM